MLRSAGKRSHLVVWALESLVSRHCTRNPSQFGQAAPAKIKLQPGGLTKCAVRVTQGQQLRARTWGTFMGGGSVLRSFTLRALARRHPSWVGLGQGLSRRRGTFSIGFYRSDRRPDLKSKPSGPQRADPPAGSSNHIQNTFKAIGTFLPAFHSGELGIGWLARIRQEWLTILVIQACIFAHLVDPYVSNQRYFTYFATKLVQNGVWLSQPFGALEVASFLASRSNPKPRLDLTHQI